ncbi:hypothetical protein [Halomonas sp.]|uniref:hypothetical protein n=1 Tax=Halomonas sp. TaxID=1486246 RepID=UPI003D0F4C3E
MGAETKPVAQPVRLAGSSIITRDRPPASSASAPLAAHRSRRQRLAIPARLHRATSSSRRAATVRIRDPPVTQELPCQGPPAQALWARV